MRRQNLTILPFLCLVSESVLIVHLMRVRRDIERLVKIHVRNAIVPALAKTETHNNETNTIFNSRVFNICGEIRQVLLIFCRVYNDN